MRYRSVEEDFEDIFVELGAIFISRVCRITVEKFLAFYHFEEKLNEATIDRLNFLAEVVKCLEAGYKKYDGSIAKWFRRRKTPLSNFSPYQIMMWPISTWRPEEEIMQKILELARGINSDAT